MAETKKIRLTKRASVTFDCFWLRTAVRTVFYLIPQIKITRLKVDCEHTLPEYVVAFHWLYILADMNIFIKKEEK